MVTVFYEAYCFELLHYCYIRKTKMLKVPRKKEK